MGSETSHEARPSARKPLPDKADRELRILVVDDALAIRRFLTAILQDIGVREVLTAEDGNAALRAIDESSEPIDLVFCDLMMPGMDGVELLREVGQRCPGVAVLTISSLDSRLRLSVSEMAQRLGMTVLGVLGKPFTEADIRRALSRFHDLRRKGMQVSDLPMTDAEINTALSNKQVVVHYQPKVRVDSAHVVGAEALVRLRDPQGGLIAPDAFIESSEAGGHIENLTYQVIEIALRDAGAWAREGLRLNIGINLSSSAIRRLDLPEHVQAVAHSHGLSPSQVTLEITESELANATELLDVCARFRMRGFGLSIDDFGTGESGLSRLRSLPFTELKIDRQYVDGAAENEELRAILSTSIDLGKRLGMTVVAEGVQNDADWALLDTLGCDVAQGYLISRPLPGDKMMSWALRWQRLADRVAEKSRQ
ncbi:EAL domain-containing response regulator [Algiphilus sp.]|uniref:EAL domain-containing response regulator n=1 Tax=Algiphilus sp. TaxID=1872431 RepID=UPI003B52765E